MDLGEFSLTAPRGRVVWSARRHGLCPAFSLFIYIDLPVNRYFGYSIIHCMIHINAAKDKSDFRVFLDKLSHLGLAMLLQIETYIYIYNFFPHNKTETTTTFSPLDCR